MICFLFSLLIPSPGWNTSYSCWNRGRDLSRPIPDCSWSSLTLPPSGRQRQRHIRALSSKDGPREDFAAFVEWTLPTQCPAHHRPTARSACPSALMTESPSPPQPTSHCCMAIAAWSNRAEDRHRARVAFTVRPGARVGNHVRCDGERVRNPQKAVASEIMAATWLGLSCLWICVKGKHKGIELTVMLPSLLPPSSCIERAPISKASQEGAPVPEFNQRGLQFPRPAQRGLPFLSLAQRGLPFLSLAQRGFLFPCPALIVFPFLSLAQRGLLFPRPAQKVRKLTNNPSPAYSCLLHSCRLPSAHHLYVASSVGLPSFIVIMAGESLAFVSSL